MPCNSDYMEASNKEIEISRVYCLLDEVVLGKKIDKNDWRGYHDAVYCKGLTKEQCDNAVETLCKTLQGLDVTKYSLELQMWWRDHQEADKKRVEREVALARDEKAKEEALAKLSDYERKLLGV